MNRLMIRDRPARSLTALALATMLLLAGCDRHDAQRQFEAEAALPPSGITPTDADGNVIGDPDPDDWRTAPAFPGITIDPAYPNPVPVGFTDPVQIHVNAPFPDRIAGGLQLLIYDPRPPHNFAVLIDQIGPGSIFHFNTLSFTRSDIQAVLTLPDARGLYRLYIQDGAARLISYGDVRVE